VSTTLDGSASFDPENQALTFTWTGPFGESPANDSQPTATFPTPTGAKTVDLVVTDTDGLGAACAADVTVQDTIVPSLTVPADITKECTSPDGTPVEIGTATAIDICDPDVAVINDAPPLFALGVTPVLWTATDDDGNQTTDTQTITVEDTTPPDIESLTATPNALWPPNHKLVDVSLTVEVSDICDVEPFCQVVSVTSDESANGLGDGNTEPDFEIVGDLAVKLRAERSGRKDGRTYSITVQCTDDSGNSADSTVDVNVAHDKGR
jgi:hypothetical protein